MSDPIPIKPGITPESDFARELLDFCATKITSYVEDYGSPPTSIALVLSGENNGNRATDAYSWDASEKRTCLETCSVASAILLKRGLGL